MRLVALVFLLLVTSQANGGVENRNLYPLGDTEIFQGNAGVAGRAGAGGVFYNPGRLASVTDHRLAVGGNAYVYQEYDVEAFARFENTNTPYKAYGFDTIPSSVISIFKWGDTTIATSILVTDSASLENRETLTTPSLTITAITNQRGSDMLAGLSVARKISPTLSAGITLYGVRHTESGTVSINLRIPSTPGSLFTTDTFSQGQVWGGTAVLGMLYEPLPELAFGLRVQTGLWKWMGRANYYTFSSMPDGAGGTKMGELEDDRARMEYRLPFETSLGARVSFLDDKLTFLLDVTAQEGLAYRRYPDLVTSDSILYDMKVRANAGMEFRLNEVWELGAGAMRNPSALRDFPAGTQGKGKDDFWGITFGARRSIDRVRTGIGVFHLWSDGDYIPAGAPNDRSIARRRITGLTLVFGYVL